MAWSREGLRAISRAARLVGLWQDCHTCCGFARMTTQPVPQARENGLEQ